MPSKMLLPPSKRRLAFVDWLRLVASIQMILGHTIEALLSEAWRKGRLFELWTLWRGLTAPAFLFASGFAFALAARLDRPGPPSGRLRRLRRGLLLIALGTLLHLGDVPHRIDILQTIGFILIFFELVVASLPSRRARLLVSAILGLGVAIGSERLDALVNAKAAQGLLRFGLSWVDPGGPALFPLFPWTSYAALGLTFSLWLAPNGPESETRSLPLRLGVIAIALAFFSMLAWKLWGPPSAHWSAAPSVIFGRLSGVTLLCAIFALLSSRWRLPPWAEFLSGQSLNLYLAHLTLIYAPFFGWARLWGPSLSLAQSLLASVLALALSAAWPFLLQRLFLPLGPFNRKFMRLNEPPLRSGRN
ncbi:MAG: heparan-alpha-glucosaminide N-acetyltransferase domain-containing protein [Sandaracinaceae bacterium]|nr:heparan-alpha-glucosaminide N-acetyltransferase domain-containing protein [Sandaracinaceae bacterium]